MTRIYEIEARIAGTCLDGRSNHGAWGHENQFHPTQESAEAAIGRLEAGGAFGCALPPTYDVAERLREDFPADNLGDQEWRRACKQAGVDPAEVSLA